ncbi:MAG: hypothetical protein Kow0074_21100 [Candidatus Zixiibacteriota bacterium]
MSRRPSTILLWIVSILITVSSAVYQRVTGPTYPVKVTTEIGGEVLTYELPRTHDGDGPAIIEIPTGTTNIKGYLSYRRVNSDDEWTHQSMGIRNRTLIGLIPHQPPAGKVMYSIEFNAPAYSNEVATMEPVVIRFKGHVPLYVLILHVFFMFAAMLLSIRAGLEAVLNRSNVLRLTLWTTGLLLIGGMILGPVVQKFAFGAFWTGWPLGTDLTDNKTAVAFIAWIVAAWRVWRNPSNRWAPIAAAILLFAVYLIPHSVLGSELDYTQVEAPQPPRPGHLGD